MGQREAAVSTETGGRDIADAKWLSGGQTACSICTDIRSGAETDTQHVIAHP